MKIQAKYVDNKNIFIVKYKIHAVESQDVDVQNVIVFQYYFFGDIQRSQTPTWTVLLHDN